MCGIAGMFGVAPESQRATVASMIRAQAHRGPDHQAVVVAGEPRGGVTLGHCRLMIVDLTAGANQPLWDRAHQCCLVFNGEVYNHVELRRELEALGRGFATRSDSEVILEAYLHWGTAAFQRLDGMFAFALYDRETASLHLVRDPFGIKPLLYLARDDRLWFASSSAALDREFHLEPDLAYLARGIRYWAYEDGDLTPYLGLRALEPGHRLEARIDRSGRVRFQKHRTYHLEQAVASTAAAIAGASERELADRFAALLEHAIDLRMRADVPVGISLSGGLDSSTVAALARTRGNVTGFTFGHPDAPATEGPMVARLARQTGLPVTFVRPSIAGVIPAVFDALAAQEEPFPSGSIVGQYLVYRAARRAGVRVVLGGQGSDEIFMGYRKFQLFHLRQLVHRRRLAGAAAFAASLLPELLAEAPRAGTYWRMRHRYLRGAGMDTALVLPPPAPMNLLLDPDQPLWMRQLHDLRHASLPTLLRYEDRNSMAHGVESRLPFLDHRLVEFALALPVSLKLRGGYRKWIVRQFARGRIPEPTRRARFKRGFDVEQAAWIDHGRGDALRHRLCALEPAVRRYLAPGARIDRLFANDRLKQDAGALAEATTLLWLGARIAVPARHPRAPRSRPGGVADLTPAS
jgi:asparagine synthase (glutamine-hydrolysing)